MGRTVTDGPFEEGNVAEGYIALADGTPYHVPRPDIEDGDPIQGAAGVESSVVRFAAILQKLYARLQQARHATKDVLSKLTLQTGQHPHNGTHRHVFRGAQAILCLGLDTHRITRSARLCRTQ